MQVRVNKEDNKEVDQPAYREIIVKTHYSPHLGVQHKILRKDKELASAFACNLSDVCILIILLLHAHLRINPARHACKAGSPTKPVGEPAGGSLTADQW